MFIIPGLSYSEKIIFISWNIESGGSNMDSIATKMESLEDIDIWALSEVPPNAKDILLNAASYRIDSNYDYVFSDLRSNDRLMIIYNQDKMKLLSKIELIEIALVTMRPALIAKFQTIETKKNFYFIVVHLARNPDYIRHAQSRAIQKWVNRRQNSRIIISGDFNYDWDVINGNTDHDKGFDILTIDDKNNQQLFWKKPVSLKCTQFTDNNNDGDNDYNSILDFIFVNNRAKNLDWKVEILETPNDFPDNEFTSDHRPLKGKFKF
jgi:endonuclease/exonuclease/phosphatase family metal-dependent hydrolase